MLKDQPKWDDSKERLRASMPLTPDSASIGEGDCEPGLGDTSNFERPTSRKAERPSERTKPQEKM